MSCLLHNQLNVARTNDLQEQTYLPARAERIPTYIPAQPTIWDEHERPADVHVPNQPSRERAQNDIRKAEGILYVPIDKDLHLTLHHNKKSQKTF